ncbi:hypothetical protein QBD00_002079 [Ochrobactrum sp. AN78]|nr:hypothetical protein [Ochrobactrum sp. AN78]
MIGVKGRIHREGEVVHIVAHELTKLASVAERGATHHPAAVNPMKHRWGRSRAVGEGQRSWGSPAATVTGVFVLGEIPTFTQFLAIDHGCGHGPSCIRTVMNCRINSTDCVETRNRRWLGANLRPIRPALHKEVLGLVSRPTFRHFMIFARARGFHWPQS